MTLKSNLIKIADATPQAVRRGLLRGADDILTVAQQLAPVRTGELRDSGKIDPVSDKKVLVGFEARHSGFVEFGTSKMEAQPFLTPAFHQSEETVKRRVEQEMQIVASEARSERVLD